MISRTLTWNRTRALSLTSRQKMIAYFVTLVFLAVLCYMLPLLIVDLPRTIQVGLSWSRTSKKGVATNFVESYCRQREQATTGASDQQGHDLDFLPRPSREEPENQMCVLPALLPCDPTIADFDRRSVTVKKVECPTEENWVYVHNGTFHISAWARWKYGKIACEYAPIVRGRGDFAARLEKHTIQMLDGSPLTADFFKVTCMSASGKHYHNIHAGVAFNESLHARSLARPFPTGAIGYDIFMLGFDSTSRMAWMRNLPRTRTFFLEELGGLELEGYNIVGDGTVQALLPILTGRAEDDLPSARRNHEGAKEVDSFPWVWNLFKKAGYVTAWAEDMSYIGTFQMRLKGFQEQPTDHYMRSYFQLAEPMYRFFSPWCVGSEVRHKRFLHWFRDLYHMYGPKPKIMFGFHSEYSHSSINDLKKIDEDLCNFLKDLLYQGYLNHTILILMADHGGRFSNIRATLQGKLEERMPYFAFRFPPSFSKSYPGHVTTFKTNTKMLTTPFDIHETLVDVLNLEEKQNNDFRRGISLFKEVPRNRTCQEAGIMPHWCSCLHWTPVADRGKMSAVAEAVVGFINNMTSHVRELCAYITLSEIISLLQYTPAPEILRYKKSLDFHGDIPDLSDNMTVEYDHFQISLITEPGHAYFEATVKYGAVTREIYVSERDISRTNRYNNASSCVQHKYPHLRPFCYCM